MDLSIIIPTLNEKDNLVLLIPKVKQVISSLTNCYEIIIVDGGSVDDTVETASSFGAKVIIHPQKGYGNALKLGFKYAKGKFILTLDADLSHNPDFIEHMWERRHEAEIIIGSRYIPGGEANMPVIRKIFSVILNFSFSKILSLPIKDFSSGFRLYKKQILEEIPLEGTQFEILEEVLIKCYAQGYQILETPLIYVPRKSGQSKAKLFKFGIVLLKTLVKMWCLRNSIDSADYDERAYISKIPLQRYWQRKRHAIITQNADSKKLTFDIGCGSSRILKTLNRAVGIDIGISRLRYMRRYHVPLVNASVFALPFKNSSVESAICSQVIEHVNYDPVIFKEMARILRVGGCLILGTPDYSTIMWRIIEPLYGFFIPGGYKDDHITHYTRKKLVDIMKENGFKLIGHFYICKAELILKFEKIH